MNGTPRHWVRIERDDTPDLLVGPYGDDTKAAHAMNNALLFDSLLSPAGGGGTEVYTVALAEGTEPADCEQVLIDPVDYGHTAQVDLTRVTPQS